MSIYVKLESNMFPMHNQIVAFKNKKKLRVGKIVNNNKTPFYVLELETNKKFFPYTQDLIPLGEESSIENITSTIIVKN